jgi:hypothetical protein
LVLLVGFLGLYLVSYVTTGGHPFKPEESEPVAPATTTAAIRCRVARGTTTTPAVRKILKQVCADLEHDLP